MIFIDIIAYTLRSRVLLALLTVALIAVMVNLVFMLLASFSVSWFTAFSLVIAIFAVGKLVLSFGNLLFQAVMMSSL